MKRQTILLGILIMLLIGSPAGAQVYKWVDENGVPRYSDSPPPEGVENYETDQEITYDEEADLARSADDDRAVEEYQALKAQQERLEQQEAEAEAAKEDAEKVKEIQEEQQKIEEQLATKTRYIRTRARRRMIRLRNIEKELATLPATPENAEKRKELETEKQSVIEGLMQNKRYFQRGGRQLVQEYEELDKALKAYQ